MSKERVLVVDLKLSRRLVVVQVVILILAVLVVSFLVNRDGAVASAETQATGMRQFYLSKSWYSAIDAPDSCAAGYHFASLWEIADPSNLKYNTSYGYAKDDSGKGPPSNYYARVRTGYGSDNSNTPGQANCNAWTTTTGFGTKVALDQTWESNPHIGVWKVTASECSATATIWCIED
jgi:type II secretory pathway pseudopilin PulG